MTGTQWFGTDTGRVAGNGFVRLTASITATTAESSAGLCELKVRRGVIELARCRLEVDSVTG
jgi:hypothetical protein